MSPRSILLALAAAGSVVAQVNRCEMRDTYTIKSSSDASALSGCTTWKGDIEIDPLYSGELTLSGVRKIDGDFTAKNVTNLQALSADSLSEITGDWMLTDVTRLIQLSFPSMRTVGGAVTWDALSGIQSVTVGPITKAKSVKVTNTRLQNLDSFNLVSVARWEVTNNDRLQTIKAQLGNVSDSLIIQGFQTAIPSVSFPNLIWAQNITLINCSSIELPSIQIINGSLALKGNTLESFFTPNLTEVGSSIGSGGSLTLNDNSNLNNISMPLLKRIGGSFQVQNNPQLAELNQFPVLANVIGALDFFGVFTKVSLPALSSVDGTFNIQSTSDIQEDCNVFAKLQASKKIRAKYVCSGKNKEVGDINKDPSKSGNSGGDGGKKNSASGLAVSVPMVMGASGVLAMVAALF
jgi:hypothetical protein